MRKSSLLAILGIVMLFSAISASATEENNNPFYLLLDARTLGGYSDLSPGSGRFSTINDWMVSPNLKVNDDLYWINVYNGSYNRLTQVSAQEEGGRQTNTTQGHALSTALKYNINESWSVRPLFFSDWVFVNEIEDEDFGDGLYDYHDIGGGVESTWKIEETHTQLKEARAGVRVFDREYPNFRSLLSIFGAPGGVTEEHEKDFDGYKFNLSYHSAGIEGISWGLESITLYKDYQDKVTIDFNGFKNAGDSREDWVQYFNAGMTYPINQEFRARLDGQFSFNISNLDFYDTHNTITPADNDFIENYYDYYLFTLKPALVFNKKTNQERDMVIVASYSFTAQIYPDRRVQNQLGVYQSDEETDYLHTFALESSVPLNKNLSWVSQVSYTIAESNQEFEQFYLYTYDLWSALTGISFKY